jgi:hypothetical protein
MLGIHNEVVGIKMLETYNEMTRTQKNIFDVEKF